MKFSSKVYQICVHHNVLSSVTIICDPIADSASVQYELLRMVVKVLNPQHKINVITPFVSDFRISEIKKMITGQVVTLSSKRLLLRMIFKALSKNESMLWALSWLLEAMLAINSSQLSEAECYHRNEKNLNISYTIPAPCDVLWNQATPPILTLNAMGKTSVLAKIFYICTMPFLSILDRIVRKRHFRFKSIFVNNSLYLKNLYSAIGYESNMVIHVPKEFRDIAPPKELPTRDYILAYIGKEVEIDTILTIASQGARIITFGAKIPYGTSLGKLKELTDFRGYIDDEELQKLYYNALFTAFPFTEEPFGWVPLESMHFGTPVLSYSKQGPKETIEDGKTGWLVNDKNEFVSKALYIWQTKRTEMSSSDCIDRSKFFSLDIASQKLQGLLDGVIINE